MEALGMLVKLESRSAISSYDFFAFLMLSNLPRASITRWMHANHEPIVSFGWSENLT